MSAVSRREFLATLSAAGIAPAAFASGRGGDWSGGSPGPAFLHGVASGDPLHDRVILWTRITPKRMADELQCEIYHVATVDQHSDQEELATVMVSEAGNNSVRPQSQAAASKPSGAAVDL